MAPPLTGTQTHVGPNELFTKGEVGNMQQENNLCMQKDMGVLLNTSVDVGQGCQVPWLRYNYAHLRDSSSFFVLFARRSRTVVIEHCQ